MKIITSFVNQQAGITALEIIIVIIIIGVIAATIGVQFADLSAAAEVATCKANQSALQTAVTSYWAMNSKYPSVVDEVAPFMNGGIIPDCPSGGSYFLVNDCDITCSLPEHQ